MMMRLACPHCQSELTMNGDGARCSEHGNFPRLGPAFSFLERQSQEFEQHWRDAAGGPLPDVKREVAERFLAPLFDEQPRSILDLGCGDGVHLAVLGDRAPVAELIGLDLSIEALASADRHVDRWTALHADAARIPLADNSVDAAISYGVLAYLGEPWRGLAELIRVTKQGGLVGVWFYPERGNAVGSLFKLIRAITGRLPRFWQRRLADLIVPFLGLLPTSSGLRLGRASWSDCREIVLVNIAPARLIFPSEEEIRRHLRELGCEIVLSDPTAPHTIWARKRGQAV